jgi:hypothetical protein
MSRIHTYNTEPKRILASSASSSSHLQVLTRLNRGKIISIKLPQLSKNDTSSRQIQTNCESACSKYNFEIAVREENLN